MPLLDAEDIASFIASRFCQASKIVEVGVGFQFDTALALKRKHPGIRLIVVDRNPESAKEAKRLGLEACVDDVWNPDMQIYRDSSLIYSIRPPPELLEPIYRISKAVGCSLLIRPLSGEYLSLPDEARWLNITYGKARLLLYPGPNLL